MNQQFASVFPPFYSKKTKPIFTVLLLCLLGFVKMANAQPATAPFNVKSPLVNVPYTDIDATVFEDVPVPFVCVGNIANVDNIENSDLTDYATISMTGILCNGTISVKDNTTADTYPAGYFAGFRVGSADLITVNLGASVTISTWNNGSPRESFTAISGAIRASVLNGDGTATLGFVTTQDFDEIRITYASLLGLAFTNRIYNAVIERFRAGPPFLCNRQTPMNNDSIPSIISSANTGVDVLVCANCSVSNTEDAISVSNSDYATISLTGIGNTGSIAVKDVLTDYPAGTFAGFNISNPNLVNVNLLSGLVVRTFLNGSPRESSTAATLTSVQSVLLNGTGEQLVGFQTTLSFDEIKLEITSTIAALNNTRVYSAIFETFCAGPALVCNTPTLMHHPKYPVFVNGANSGIDPLVCIGCSLIDAQNVITEDSLDYATLLLDVAVGSTGSIAVRDAVTDYPAGTFTGFNISNPLLVNANVLSGLTIRTYLNGTPRESTTASTLVSAGTFLTQGNGAQIVGFVTSLSFDEVKLEVSNLIGALSTTRIYNAVFETFCPGPPLTCATGTTYLTSPTYPLIIDGKLTGMEGAACVCTLNNTQRLIDADTTNYAEIDLEAGVISSVSIAVKNVLATYPAGTFAGFDVENPNLLGVDLLTNLRIRTYLNGVERDNRAAGTLLSLQLFGATRQIVGFTTTLSFDEIRITAANLVGANLLGTTRIRGAVLRAASAAGSTAPVFTTAIINGSPAVNACPVLTVNLNSYVTSTTPVGATLVWFTNATHTGTPYATPTTATAGVYYAFYLSGGICYSFTSLPVTVKIKACTRPDMNVTIINVTVNGDVSINDKAPANTTYGTPAAIPGDPNPSASMPVMNSDGTYSFTPDNDGVYKFLVPVCVPDQVPPCPSEVLIITVVAIPDIDVDIPPIANIDIAAVEINSTVIIQTLANDAAGTAGTSLLPGSVTLTDMNGGAPGNTSRGGTVTVDPLTGNTTYTPPTGFIGTDTVQYTVCDDASPQQCATSWQFVFVQDTPPPNTTTGADDFNQTFTDNPVSGNVKVNDTDPDGDAQTVSAQSTTIPGKGTLVIQGDGTYTFTPVAGFTGPVDFGYRVCDFGICDSATLHILVKPFNPNPDENVTLINVPVSGSVMTNDDIPAGSTFGIPVASPGNPNAVVPTLNADGTYSFVTSLPGVYEYTIQVCTPSPASVCKNETLTITVNDPTVTTNKPIANPDQASVYGSPTSPTQVTLNLKINDIPGNTNGVLGTPSIVSGPLHGVASIDGNGNLLYTPTAGFYGKDTVVYQVCETPGGLCTTSLAIVDVLPPGNPFDVTATDDNSTTPKGQPITVSAAGGVIANDNTTGAGTLTVTTQNTTIPGKGTLVLNGDGSYTFTPEAGFTGPVDFDYKVCDGVTCDSATLHILVMPGFITLQVKVLLQGALNPEGSGLETTMRDNLRSSTYAGVTGNRYIPNADPYTNNTDYSTQFTKVGDGTNPAYQSVVTPSTMFADRTATTTSAVDWIFVELRSKADPTIVQGTRSVIVQQDGSVVDIDGSSCIRFPSLLNDDYYVAIRHRNHLGVMTATAIPAANLSCSSVVDFTIMTNAQLWHNPATPQYDGLEMATTTNSVSNLTLKALWAGNANGDNKVKYQGGGNDRTLVQSDVTNFPGNTTININFDQAFGYLRGDINMDSKAKYQGSGNDRTILQSLVLGYLLNTTANINYDLFLQQLP
ncbi:MAG: Ig-like domain-containing protein [Bacteroidota bacterium]